MEQNSTRELEENMGRSGRLASPQEIAQSVKSAEDIIRDLGSTRLNQMIEDGDIVVEKTTDSDGNMVNLTVKDGEGQMVFFEDVRWFDKRIVERENKISIKQVPDRETTNDEVREALETGGMAGLEAEPETDPQKIN